MNAKASTVLIVLTVAGVAGGIAFLEADKAKLRRQIAQLAQNEVNLARARDDLGHAKALASQLRMDTAEGSKAIHAALLQARLELTALEKKAVATSAGASGQTPPAADASDSNRDPEMGMVKPEFLVESGRATPATAFQTLIWAAMKGQEDKMAACVAVEGVTRQKAEQLLEALPTESRAKYRTPEQLAALFFANAVMESTAFQFVGSSFTDGDHANVTVRIQANGRERETKVPMIRSADGWRMAVSEKQIDGIRSRLLGDTSKR